MKTAMRMRKTRAKAVEVALTFSFCSPFPKLMNNSHFFFWLFSLHFSQGKLIILVAEMTSTLSRIV